MSLATITALIPGAVFAETAPDTCAKVYTIQSGDSLGKIAAKYLGSTGAYPAIVEATNQMHETDNSFAQITNPNVVGVGWKLCVPDATDVPIEAAASVPVSTPQSAGSAGKIVFQTASGGPIYIVNADGSDLRYLTYGMDPAWSPKGEYVAFTRWGYEGGVYVIDADGQNERRLHSYNVQMPKSPRWSPDGAELVFNRYDGGPMQNYDWERNFSFKHPVTGEVIASFSFTIEDMPPDAHWLLRVLKVWDGSQWDGIYRDISSDKYAYAPDWSPDGDKIVYDGRIGLGMTTPDEVDQSANHWDFTAHYGDAMPMWSPDGDKIAFNFWQHDHWEIYTINADGSGLKRLTQNDIFADRAPDNVAPAWSPDGKAIAFLTNRAASSEWEIYVMNANGSDQRLLFPNGLGDVTVHYDYANERVLDWTE